MLGGLQLSPPCPSVSSNMKTGEVVSKVPSALTRMLTHQSRLFPGTGAKRLLPSTPHLQPIFGASQEGREGSEHSQAEQRCRRGMWKTTRGGDGGFPEGGGLRGGQTRGPVRGASPSEGPAGLGHSLAHGPVSPPLRAEASSLPWKLQDLSCCLQGPLLDKVRWKIGRAFESHKVPHKMQANVIVIAIIIVISRAQE